MTSITTPELHKALRFYRLGPLANKQCRQLQREIVKELRKRKYEKQHRL